MSQRPHSKPARSVVAALDKLEQLYETASAGLVEALDRYLASGERPSKETLAALCYPLLRVVYHDASRPVPTHRRAFGRLGRLGVYQTTITHPREFRSYLAEQLQPLATEYGARIEVEPSRQRIPYPYVLDRAVELAGAAANVADLAKHFPTPQLSSVGDEIADGAWDFRDGEPRPLALFDAVRVDYSLQRLLHYTGSDWRHVQHWILLTNYHRYVDRFVRWARGQIGAGHSSARLVLPGNITIGPEHSDEAAEALIAGSAWHRFQMPAYHLTAPDGEGVTLVNIGVGPSNAKTITDHLAVLRPNVWLMVGHCGGLRQSQHIGDYVLAHAYLRQDHILDDVVPPDIPIPALAETQVALQDAAAMVTGEEGEALKRRLRTGTVVTNDDRNWELRFTQERKRINLSRAIAVDMESGTVAAQGYRLRVPYGTLLCVSDKPLHGEIKLPGTANVFYETAVGQHLEIGLKALDLLRKRRDTLHSRKLRSFDEPPFR
jgi:AMP nucleosidase